MSPPPDVRGLCETLFGCRVRIGLRWLHGNRTAGGATKGGDVDEPKEDSPDTSSSSADERDRNADALDAEADRHDDRVNLNSWLNDESGQAYGERKSAAQSRARARPDRSPVAEQRSAQTVDEVDVEVRVGDTWWPGYLYRRDWRKNLEGHWQCFVCYTAPDPTEPGVRAAPRNGYFNDDNIRPLRAS